MLSSTTSKSFFALHESDAKLLNNRMQIIQLLGNIDRLTKVLTHPYTLVCHKLVASYNHYLRLLECKIGQNLLP